MKKVISFKKESGVYKITNLITNDIYIGSTGNVCNRYYSHWNLFKIGKHDNSKMRQHAYLYGRDSFLFEVLEYCSKEIMIDREQYYFELLKPTYNAWPTVYNATGRTYTDEQYEKLRTTKHTIKDIEAYKAARKAMWAERRKDPNYREKYLKHLDKTGCKHTQETKELMSKQRKGTIKPESMREKTRQRRLGTKLINGHYIKVENHE